MKKGQQPRKFLNSLVNHLIHDDLSRASIDLGLSKTCLLNRWLAYILSSEDRIQKATKHKQDKYEIS